MNAKNVQEMGKKTLLKFKLYGKVQFLGENL